MRELFHEEQCEGFTIRFYAEPEDSDPNDSFEDLEDVEAVRSGKWLWFQVQCVASKSGVELGHDYLGACAYETYEDFLTPGGYADDMRNMAIDAARSKLAELCA